MLFIEDKRDLKTPWPSRYNSNHLDIIIQTLEARRARRERLIKKKYSTSTIPTKKK